MNLLIKVEGGSITFLRKDILDSLGLYTATAAPIQFKCGFRRKPKSTTSRINYNFLGLQFNLHIDRLIITIGGLSAERTGKFRGSAKKSSNPEI